MFIDVRTIDSIIKSLTEIFNTTPKEIIYIANQINKLEYDKFISFVNERLIRKPDKIMIFHLSRRLNSDTKDKIINSIDNLLKESPYTRFLNKYDISFTYRNGKFDILKNNKIINLSNYYDNDAKLLKNRLGQSSIKDYSICGFMFMPTKSNTDYLDYLKEGPEFIINISALFGDKIMQDYKKNSKYYCYIAIVPIDIVEICDNKALNAISVLLYNCFIKINAYINKSDNGFINDIIMLPNFYQICSNEIIDIIELSDN